MTAVVDASFRADGDEDDDEDDENGLGGVVSDAAALEMYLRLESGKQRDCVEKFVSEEERENVLSATSRSVGDVVEDGRGDENDGNETMKSSEKLREAERAAGILRTHGLVFLKSVVPEETCDEILADLNAICDGCKETYGDALRRTDVLLGLGDEDDDSIKNGGKINGVKKALESACKKKEETYGTSSRSSRTPPRTPCWSNSPSSPRKKAPTAKCCTQTSPTTPRTKRYIPCSSRCKTSRKTWVQRCSF